MNEQSQPPDAQDEIEPIKLKACPFCAGLAQIIPAGDGTDFTAQCSVCEATAPGCYVSELTAAAAWNQRCGSPSAAGGKATRGISTKRKRASSKRNLRRARWVHRCRKMADRFQCVCLLRNYWESLRYPMMADRAPQLREELVAAEALLTKFPDLQILYRRLLSINRPAQATAVG